MDKSSASSQSKKPSTGRRVRMIPSTPHPETMTPPAPQSMVLPAVSISQPPETSEGKMYLEILKDAIGKFSPTEKMSEIFAQLANKLKKKEEQPTPIPIGIPTDTAVQTEVFAEQPPTEQVTSQTPSPAADSAKIYDHQEKEADIEEEVEPGAEGNSRKEEGDGERNDVVEEETVQKPVKERSLGTGRVVVDVEEEVSDKDRETLSEKAARRSLRTRRRLETEETMSLREEAAILASARRAAAERKRKGKQMATPSTNKKPK